MKNVFNANKKSSEYYDVLLKWHFLSKYRFDELFIFVVVGTLIQHWTWTIVLSILFGQTYSNNPLMWSGSERYWNKRERARENHNDYLDLWILIKVENTFAWKSIHDTVYTEPRFMLYSFILFHSVHFKRYTRITTPLFVRYFKIYIISSVYIKFIYDSVIACARACAIALHFFLSFIKKSKQFNRKINDGLLLWVLYYWWFNLFYIFFSLCRYCFCVENSGQHLYFVVVFCFDQFIHSINICRWARNI